MIEVAYVKENYKIINVIYSFRLLDEKNRAIVCKNLEIKNSLYLYAVVKMLINLHLIQTIFDLTNLKLNRFQTDNNETAEQSAT